MRVLRQAGSKPRMRGSTCTDTLVRSLCEAAMCVGWGCRVIKNRVYCVAGSGQQHVHRHTGAEHV